MMIGRKANVLALAFFVCSPAHADDPVPFAAKAVLNAPERIPYNAPDLVIRTEGSLSRKPLKLKAKKPRNLVFESYGPVAIVKQPVPGTVYEFEAMALGDVGPDGFPDFDTTSIEVIVDPVPDQPRPPKPVDPRPDDPRPVDPKPDDKPQGLVVNLRVLVVSESSAKLSVAQWNAIHSTIGIIPYLDRKCVRNPDGSPGWKIWDPNKIISKETSDWQNMMYQSVSDPKPIPKVCIFDGTRLVETRTVVDENDTLAFLKSKAGE